MVLALACAPPTDLAAQRASRGRSDGGAGAAGAATTVVVLPSPGAVAPRNLAAVVVRDQPDPVRLRPPSGPAMALGPAEPAPCGGASRCFASAVPMLLSPATSYGVEGGDGRVLGRVTVGTVIDRDPPRIAQLRVEPSADCVRVRFSTDEPVRALVTLRAAAGERQLPAGDGPMNYDIAVRPGLRDGGQLVVAARDWAGNLAESSAVAVAGASPPALVITEVLANPAGPEATQEYVELRNVGDVAVALQEYLIEDGAGADALPAGELAPGAFALVVAAGYDAAQGRDPPPAPGTALVRVEGRIGRDGIGNANEPVTLRRSTGEAVSRYGGWVDMSATSWAGRSVQRTPHDACDHPTAWSTEPRLPTPGW